MLASRKYRRNVFACRIIMFPVQAISEARLNLVVLDIARHFLVSCFRYRGLDLECSARDRESPGSRKQVLP